MKKDNLTMLTNRQNTERESESASRARSNFIKINSLMNQRLNGLVNFLKTSTYLSYYNDIKKKKFQNLSKFFKSNILEKKIICNYKTLHNKITPNLILFDTKHDSFSILKKKHLSPYYLHIRKNHLLKSMVELSKETHSQANMEAKLKRKYLHNWKPKKKQIYLLKGREKNEKFLNKNSNEYEGMKTLGNNYNKKNIFRKFLNTERNNNFDINNNNYLITDVGVRSKSHNIYTSRPNCYYNRINLNKIQKKLNKFTYQNLCE